MNIKNMSFFKLSDKKKFILFIFLKFSFLMIQNLILKVRIFEAFKIHRYIIFYT